MLADFTRSISLAETLGQVEHDIAATLRAIAGRDEGPAAERRRRLADEADRGEQAAAKASERLRQQARQWAEHADVNALAQALDHTATVLAELAHAEDNAVGILADLARCDDPDLAARSQHLAAEATAAGRGARDLAQALHELVEAEVVKAQPADRSAARTRNARRDVESVTGQRLADIDQRLAELRQAHLKPQPPTAEPKKNVQWLVQQAQRHSQESIAHLRQTRQLAVEALGRAANAHDRAAEANERAAAAGVGDVAEQHRLAASHRAAAQADRQRAQELHDRFENIEVQSARQPANRDHPHPQKDT